MEPQSLLRVSPSLQADEVLPLLNSSALPHRVELSALLTRGSSAASCAIVGARSAGKSALLAALVRSKLVPWKIQTTFLWTVRSSGVAPPSLVLYNSATESLRLNGNEDVTRFRRDYDTVHRATFAQATSAELRLTIDQEWSFDWLDTPPLESHTQRFRADVMAADAVIVVCDSRLLTDEKWVKEQVRLGRSMSSFYFVGNCAANDDHETETLEALEKRFRHRLGLQLSEMNPGLDFEERIFVLNLRDEMDLVVKGSVPSPALTALRQQLLATLASASELRSKALRALLRESLSEITLQLAAHQQVHAENARRISEADRLLQDSRRLMEILIKKAEAYQITVGRSARSFLEMKLSEFESAPLALAPGDPDVRLYECIRDRLQVWGTAWARERDVSLLSTPCADVAYQVLATLEAANRTIQADGAASLPPVPVLPYSAQADIPRVNLEQGVAASKVSSYGSALWNLSPDLIYKAATADYFGALSVLAKIPSLADQHGAQATRKAWFANLNAVSEQMSSHLVTLACARMQTELKAIGAFVDYHASRISVLIPRNPSSPAQVAELQQLASSLRRILNSPAAASLPTESRYPIRVESRPSASLLSQLLLPRKAAPRAPSKDGIRILALDGGGMRGLALIAMLRFLQAACNDKPLNQCFDLICGTSTGAIIAVALAQVNKSLDECERMYKNLGGKIFANKRTIPIPGFYDAEALEKILRSEGAFADAILDSTSPYVFTVSVQLGDTSAGKPFLFRSYDHAAESLAGKSFPQAWQAVRCSSAAPVYFAPFLEGTSTFIDGGVGGNNPTGFAIQEAHALWPNTPIKVVMSLGTGQVPGKKQAYKFGDSPLGYLSVLETIVETATSSSGTDSLLASVLPRLNTAYYRWSPALIERIELDETRPAQLDWMVSETRSYMGTKKEQLQEAAALLVRPE